MSALTCPVNLLFPLICGIFPAISHLSALSFSE
jgi:hypothetical protein